VTRLVESRCDAAADFFGEYNFPFVLLDSLTVAPRRAGIRPPHTLAKAHANYFDPKFFMRRDGEYAVWFRTLHGEGTGIVFLDNGRITGGDSMFSYGGSYEIDGDRFTATLTTRRYAEGTTTVFGVDEVEARLTGTFKGAIAVCSGVAEQAPGVRFEAMLFSQQQAHVPEVNRAPAKPGAARLLKIPDGRSGARNPFRS
jgi:hypothetical protein